MENQKPVIINGRHYDPQTGLPVTAAAARKTAAKPNRPAATSVHATLERSQTLNRRVVRKNAPVLKSAAKPTPRQTVASAVHASPQKGRTMDIARSRKVTRFAPTATAAPKPVAKPVDHHPHVPHPMAERALKRHHRTLQKSVKKPASAAQTKERAITAAMAAPSPSRKPIKKKGFWARHRRLWIVLGIVLIILGVGGYTAYVNLPGLSVVFAAQQAGIKATYPGYTPDGYSLQQPITFAEGQVTITFVSNGSGKGYSITETRSSWDSSAVLENVVQKAAGTNYITTQDSGLTIYTYSGNAAWVNNGILYTIETGAPLSNEQVRNIATSL